MEKILYREGFTAEELPNEVIERIKGVSYKENPYVKLGDLAYELVRAVRRFDEVAVDKVESLSAVRFVPLLRVTLPELLYSAS